MVNRSVEKQYPPIQTRVRHVMRDFHRAPASGPKWAELFVSLTGVADGKQVPDDKKICLDNFTNKGDDHFFLKKKSI